MSIEREITQEAVPIPETLSPDELKWFAGAFEVGGSMGIGVNKKDQTYPYFNLYEADEGLIDFLKGRYGGTKYPVGNTFLWRLSGHKAAEIMVEMEPYTVTRSEICLAGLNWLNAESKNEKIQIAEDLKQKEHEELSPDEYTQRVEKYKELVAQPAFLAGIIDHRGTIIPHKGKGIRVNIDAANHALLKAIETVYGGAIHTRHTKGSVRMISGVEYTLKKDSSTLRIDAAQARMILAKAFPFLRVTPYEGWNTRYIDEAEAARQEEVDVIELILREELDSFKRGEIDRLKTPNELADSLRMSLATFRSRVRALPKDLRDEREAILRSDNRRGLTRGDVASLIKLIVEEFEEVIAGKRSTLTSNSGLAALMGVDVQRIEKHVTPLLDPELRKKRNKLLRAEAAKQRNKQYGNPNPKSNL